MIKAKKKYSYRNREYDIGRREAKKKRKRKQKEKKQIQSGKTVETRTFLIRTAFDDNDNDIMIEEKYILLSYSVILSVLINNEKENK